MKASALIVLVLTLATTIVARPPSFDSDEYVDNNVVDSIPAAELDEHNYEEEERSEYVEM
jgi:hypothetical protein